MPSDVSLRLALASAEPSVVTASSVTGEPARTEVGQDGVGFAEALSSSLSRASQSSTPSGAVVPTRTPISSAQAAGALREAYTQVVGQPPSDQTLSILVAQWSHETGEGRAMFNYNFGGLKASSSGRAYTAYRTHEGSGASRHVETAKFRAYSTAVEGATDYVQVLQRRFGAALDAAQQGDSAGFVHALKRAGYFTDSEATYAHSIESIARRALSGLDTTTTSSADAGQVAGAEAKASGATTSGSTAGSFSVPRSVDLERMTDELTRAALRIAARGDRTEES